MIGSLGLALLAGLLSTLSPCVLPLVPIVLGTAASRHPLGPVALAAGVALSFVSVGLFVATVGFSIGLDGGVFRALGALVLLALGVVMLVPPLQARLAFAGAPISRWADQRFGEMSSTGLAGQFGVGLLLGAVWSPCVGPTLGAASVLAAQGHDLGAVALTMMVFGLGAALPLALLGMLSRQALPRWRKGLSRAGHGLKLAMGVILIVISAAILSGLDKSVETILVAASPDWLSDLTSRF